MTSVDALLARHKSDVAALRGALSAQIDLPSEFDDIRLLRYVLSYPNHKMAERMVRLALEYRGVNARWLSGSSPPHESQMTPFLKCSLHGEEGQLQMFYMRTGVGVKTLKEQPRQDIALLCESGREYLIYVKEAIFRRCEELTRQNRVLTKLVVVHTDMFQFPRWVNTNLFNMFRDVSEASSFLHPQLMHRQVVLEPPRLFSCVWRVLKPMLPTKTVDRIVFCQRQQFIHEIMEYADSESIPSLAGGACECPNGCVTTLELSKMTSVPAS